MPLSAEWIENARRDLRHAGRTLIASPLFTLTAVASLALGIGANTAVFTLMRASLWKPLPVRHPEQLVQAMRITPGSPDSDGSFSYVLYEQIRRAAAPFGDVAATAGFGLRRFGTDTASAERVVGEAVSGNYFALLGVDPVLGRLIGPEDDSSAGGNAVVVLSHRFWTRRFQADPSIIGRTVYYRESPYTVVGVAAESFNGVEAEAQVDLWALVSAEAPKEWLRNSGYNWLRFLARVRPGVDPTAIAPALDAAFRSHMAGVLPLIPEPHRSVVAKHRLVVRPAGSGLASTGRRYQKPLVVLLAVVGLVLLISCANVANLILARNAARSREISVRMALGAGRWRIAGQLLAESLVLTVAGAAAGVAVAVPACRTLVNLLPQSTPPLSYHFRPDAAVFAFTAAIAAGVAALFGVAPALGASRNVWLGGTRATWRPRIGRLLVAGQLALSLLLLIGAGLFVGTLRNIEAIDLGFRTQRLTAFTLSFPRGTAEARIRSASAGIREYLERTPGVTAVTRSLPGLYASGGWSTPVERDGQPATPADSQEVGALSVEPGFFETVGMGLVEGRYPTEREAAAPVALINEKLARYLFGGESAVGRRIRLPQLKPAVREVIGVVPNAKHYGAREEGWRMVYLPEARDGQFLVRSREAFPQVAAAVRGAISAAGQGARIEKLGAVDDIVKGTMGRERLVAALSTVFGVLATLLAAIGLYGVLAYGVSRRTAEMGIRIALGAQRRDVEWLVLRETAGIVAAGTAAGLAAALGATRLIGTMLYGITPGNSAVFAGAAAILAVVAALAGLLPARRASRIDPMAALRRE